MSDMKRARGSVWVAPVEVKFECPECRMGVTVDYCEVAEEFEGNGFPEFDWECGKCGRPVHIEIVDWV